MYFNALNNFSSMHFVDWKPLKVGNQPRHRSVNLLVFFLEKVSLEKVDISLYFIKTSWSEHENHIQTFKKLQSG